MQSGGCAGFNVLLDDLGIATIYHKFWLTPFIYASPFLFRPCSDNKLVRKELYVRKVINKGR